MPMVICRYAVRELALRRSMCCILRVARQKCLGLRFAFVRLKRAGCEDQSAARLHPTRRTVQHRALDCRKIVDRLQINAMQHVRMPPHRPRRAARCIEQYRIKQLRRFPFHYIGVDALGIQLRSFQIGHQPVHAPCAVVERGNGKASRRKLHRLATRRCT